MLIDLPRTFAAVVDWTWEHYRPHVETLLALELTASNLDEWLRTVTHLLDIGDEQWARLSIASDQNTADEAAKAAYLVFVDDVQPHLLRAEQQFKAKLLDSGLEPDHYVVQLQGLRADAALFCEANVALGSELERLTGDYLQTRAMQSIDWNGGTLTMAQAYALLLDHDREVRERCWRAISDQSIHNRRAVNAVWSKLFDLRTTMAANAEFTSYRDYMWQVKRRFDYTPADNERLLDAVEQVCAPVYRRRMEKRRAQLGIDRVRPWDTLVDPLKLPPLRPFQDAAGLIDHVSRLFHQIDPTWGGYFDQMRAEDLLDLEPRKNKAVREYQSALRLSKRPFVFMNIRGLHRDVRYLLHEGMHGLHVFEKAHLPYWGQQEVQGEFSEMVAMAMMLLPSGAFARQAGGFYSDADARRARLEQLDWMIGFWTLAALTDSFDHWAYTHPDAGVDPTQCDAKWADLAGRFRPGVDFDGFEDIQACGWHYAELLFTQPFYYVEYAIALLGSVQVYANYLHDPADTVARLRKAMALGATASVPELYEAAGIRFSLDADSLTQAMALVEAEIAELEAANSE